MRAFLTFMVTPILAGCIAQGGRTGPGDIPSDAIGAMYTDMPADQIASCFAQAIGGTIQASGSRFLVTSPNMHGATYDVGSNATGGDYPIEVIVRGKQAPVEQQRVSACFTSLPHAA